MRTLPVTRPTVRGLIAMSRIGQGQPASVHYLPIPRLVDHAAIGSVLELSRVGLLTEREATTALSDLGASDELVELARTLIVVKRRHRI